MDSEDTCEGVEEKLKKMTQEGNNNGVICHTTKTPPKGSDTEAKQKKASAKLTSVGPNATPLPDWCKNLEGGEWQYGERRTACRREKGRRVEIWKLQDGKVIIEGVIWYIEANLVVADATNTRQWTIEETLLPYKMEGSAAGATVSGAAFCNNSCRAISTDYPKQIMVLDQEITGWGWFETTVSERWQKEETLTNVFRVHGKPGYTLDFRMVQGAKIRCDRAVPAQSVRVGCVFPQFAPTMTYQLTGPYPELARHIKMAQESGLPGKPGGAPLHRLTSPVDPAETDYITRNGDTACPNSGAGWTPRPPGKQCDEYPFRSTVEGAYTAGSYTPDDPATPPTRPYQPRTHNANYCGSFPSPVYTWDPTWDPDPVGYSVCWIDGKQNTNGGLSLKNKLYSPERVLEGDAFFVSIQ
ncbi:hypothetical protein ACFHW2_11715 [Actinomadura sp. LOL_016]|uniref:hypothetical protein n=1 Tax=Actinomadura sp. LOL_016 TaxID=3345411 RepID=UPI003A851E84